ncbi:hypothetical protein GCM10010207_34940 [Streptomyces atratus]|nr:hypothetical protein GCM10010207_34940 [Streptomyces atratus]
MSVAVAPCFPQLFLNRRYDRGQGCTTRTGDSQAEQKRKESAPPATAGLRRVIDNLSAAPPGLR